ncbi:DUF5994 family protein [Streptomyces sp. NPDC006700]|uniref:DUF5994 family protein n=1 Tax=unclassified Streptomyces TaxID=2593676 RepID=UPI0033F98808
MSGPRWRTGRAAPEMSTPLPSTGPWAGPGAPHLPRLALDPTLSHAGLFDGAWWPRSRDIRAELPDMLTAVSAHVGRILRVSLSSTAWDDVPRTVTADGLAVRIGWCATSKDTMSLSQSMQDHILVLVIPPDTEPGVAAAAMATASTPGNNTPAAELLGLRPD